MGALSSANLIGSDISEVVLQTFSLIAWFELVAVNEILFPKQNYHVVKLSEFTTFNVTEVDVTSQP